MYMNYKLQACTYVFYTKRCWILKSEFNGSVMFNFRFFLHAYACLCFWSLIHKTLRQAPILVGYKIVIKFLWNLSEEFGNDNFRPLVLPFRPENVI